MSENMERFRHLDGTSARIDTEYIKIDFQHGNPDVVGKNGATIEEVLEVLVQKILDFQGRELACLENAVALWHLDAAQEAMLQRRMRRQEQGVLGSKDKHQTEEVPLRKAELQEFPSFSS